MQRRGGARGSRDAHAERSRSAERGEGFFTTRQLQQHKDPGQEVPWLKPSGSPASDMASSAAPMGRRNGESQGPAIELIKNPRRQYGASPTSPPYCRLRFLISFPVRALAGPSMYTFHADGPFTGLSPALRSRLPEYAHCSGLPDVQSTVRCACEMSQSVKSFKSKVLLRHIHCCQSRMSLLILKYMIYV